MKEKNYKTELIQVYFFLMIFTAVNRVFVPFGFDLRYILVLLGLAILIDDFREKNFKPAKAHYRMMILYSLALLSSLRLIYNFEVYNQLKLIEMMILISSNLISILVISNHQQKVSSKEIYWFFTVTIIVLLLSMIYTHIFGNMDAIFGTYKGFAPQKNFLGQDKRIAGYAEDANHASFWLITYLLLTFKNNVSKKRIIIVSLIVFYFYLLSSSKTLILAFMFGFSFIVIKKNLIKRKKFGTLHSFRVFVVYGLPFLIITGIIIGYEILPFSNLDTMRTRYHMWTEATDLFLSYPLFGAGITAFRNHFEQIGLWYVQAHSTIFQLISELGFIGLILYLNVINNWLKYRDDINTLLTIFIFVFSFTNELIYLPMFLVYSLILREKSDNLLDQAHIYIINTTRGGGAEKVVKTLAYESHSDHKKTFVICLSGNDSNLEGVTLVNIGEEKKKSIISWILSKYKLEKELLNIYYIHNIELLTSHLPQTQLLSIGSFFEDRIVFVAHGSLSLLGNGITKYVKARLLYSRHHIFSVSCDIISELDNYNIVPRKKVLVENPVRFDEVRMKSMDKRIDVGINPYIVFVGRLDQNKDPMFLIDAFQKYLVTNNEYKLVIIGDGVLKVDLEKKIRDCKLENKVLIIGYQENPYPFIKNAKVLVSTSWFEAQPVTIIESLFLGTPVVTTNSSSTLEKISINEADLFICKKEIDQFVFALQKATGREHKVETKIDKYDSKVVYKKYLELYRKMIGDVFFD